MEHPIGFRDERKREIIGGKVLLMAPPGSEHGGTSANIGWILRGFLRNNSACRLLSETSVHLSKDDVVVPDLSIVCDLSKIKQTEH